MMVAGMDDSDGPKFIAHSSYMDQYHLLKMVDMVMLELCGLRSQTSRHMPRLPVQVMEGVEVTHVTSESLERSRDLGLQRLANLATETSKYLSEISELTLAQASQESDGAASSALILSRSLDATNSKSLPRSTPSWVSSGTSGRELVVHNTTHPSQESRSPVNCANEGKEANSSLMSI